MVGPADGREEGASEGPEEGSRDGEMLGLPDGTLEGVEEGDDDSTSDGFELGFWLTVGSSDAVNDGAPLGLVEGDDVVGATCIKEEERGVERGQFEMISHTTKQISLFSEKRRRQWKRTHGESQLTRRWTDTGNQTGRIRFCRCRIWR